MTIRQLGNLVFSLSQFIAPFFHTLTGLGASVESRAAVEAANSPETPAGYAFIIWFVIFSLALAYGIHQNLPYQRQNALYRSLGGWTAILFLCSTAWMVLAQLVGDGWHLVVLIVAMLVCALKAFHISLGFLEPIPVFTRRTLLPMLGLISGWLSIAVFLNFISVVKAAGLLPPQVSTIGVALVVLGLGGAFSLVQIVRSKGNLWYGGTTLWALAAVFVQNSAVAPNPLLAGFASGAFLVTVMTLLKARRRRVAIA